MVAATAAEEVGRLRFVYPIPGFAVESGFGNYPLFSHTCAMYLGRFILQQ